MHTTLIDLVSDRTGYPAEMLDLDLDLEADLSIDSIKRLEIVGELLQSLGVAGAQSDSDALMEQLAAQKTLRQMIEWLEQQAPAAEGGEQAATEEASAPEVTEAADVQTVLLSIVSERTGYPVEALDLSLDLEADLSIDSIKRLEIVGELSQQLQLGNGGTDNDAVMEELAALKTLDAIVDWLHNQSAADDDTDNEPAAPEPAPEPDVEESLPAAPELSRYVMKVAPAGEVVRADLELKDKQFLITDDKIGIAPLLKTLLEQHSASVEIIDVRQSSAEPVTHSIDGLIHLASLNPDARVADVKHFFNLARDCLMHDMSYLLVASGLGGTFGYFDAGKSSGGGFDLGSGMAGMVKSIAKEFSDLRAHWVDLDPAESADELAAYLELELLAENPLTEVGYRAGVRREVDVVKQALSEASGDELELNGDSVVLITGGAQGITAKVAVELASRYGCRLELVGRSPEPEASEPPEYAQAPDLMALRKLLIQRESHLTPAEIEQRCSKILSARAIRQTLLDIRAAGGTVNYHSLDVRDTDAFSHLIDQLYRQYGVIDGVIHGAGVVEDKLLRHKTSESFDRVFDTKVRGAQVLSAMIRDDAQFVVFFSSVAGAFGNRGQVDYASANDVLDRIAHNMKRRLPGRVLSVNWGPWADKGMVSEELEREYTRKGIGLIPVDEGVEALFRELQYGDSDDAQVVLMCASAESMQ